MAQVTTNAPEQATTPPEQSTEQFIWNYLVKTYEKHQVAGIMGNLYQENRFNTSGDGIAQWNGGRLAQLKQRGSWQDLSTQLDFMIYELNTYESGSNNHLKSTTTVEEATISFQNNFERCNPIYCMQDQRIQYAINYYNKYKEI